jgi:hypothetical protein
MKTLAGREARYLAPKSDLAISSLNPVYCGRCMTCKTTVQIHFTARNSASDWFSAVQVPQPYLIKLLRNVTNIFPKNMKRIVHGELEYF